MYIRQTFPAPWQMCIRDRDFFREVKGIFFALLKGQEGVILQILNGNAVSGGQGVGYADEYMGAGFKQRMEYKAAFLEQLFQHLPVKIIDEMCIRDSLISSLYWRGGRRRHLVGACCIRADVPGRHPDSGVFVYKKGNFQMHILKRQSILC